MSKLTMTPANKDWDKIPCLNQIKDIIAMERRKLDCTPDDLDISATFLNGRLQYVKTKRKAV